MEAQLRKLPEEFRRYLLGGLLNTSFSYGIYAILVYLGLTYLIANLGAAILGTLFSFQVSKAYVFQRGSWKRYGRFVAVWILVWLTGSLSLVTFIEGFGLTPLIAGVAALPITAATGYLPQKLFVFHPTL